MVVQFAAIRRRMDVMPVPHLEVLLEITQPNGDTISTCACWMFYNKGRCSLQLDLVSLVRCLAGMSLLEH